MAYLGDIQTAGTPQTIPQVMDYVRRLEEQIRYVLENIGNENIQDGAIGEKKLAQPLIRGIRKTADDTRTDLEKTEKRLTDAIKKDRQRMAEIDERLTGAIAADREAMAAAGMGASGIDLDAATENPPIYSTKTALDKNGLTVKSGGTLKVYDATAQQLVDVAADAAQQHRNGWVQSAAIVSGALVLTMSDGSQITYGGI